MIGALSTIGLTAVVLFISMALYSRTTPVTATPVCPTCDVAYLVLESPVRPERRTYDVLVCPECTAGITRVLGARSRFAWCPACRQRTLETPVHHVPATPNRPHVVRVEEHCHVCGFQDTVDLPNAPIVSPQPELPDNVVAFRTR